jgi:hypothetical protein
MAKNTIISDKLELAICRIDFLVKEGFTKKQIADMAGIKYQTLQKISKAFSKDISDVNHEKIKKLHSDYIIRSTNNSSDYFLDDEPVIDSQDAEEGAKEVAMWLGITVAIGLLALIGLAFVVRYIIGLF